MLELNVLNPVFKVSGPLLLMTRSQFPSSTCSMNWRAASRVHVLYIAFRNLLLVLSSCSCTFLYVICLGSPTLYHWTNWKLHTRIMVLLEVCFGCSPTLLGQLIGQTKLFLQNSKTFAMDVALPSSLTSIICWSPFWFPLSDQPQKTSTPSFFPE